MLVLLLLEAPIELEHPQKKCEPSILSTSGAVPAAWLRCRYEWTAGDTVLPVNGASMKRCDEISLFIPDTGNENDIVDIVVVATWSRSITRPGS